ncbi:MAG: PTS sugar transporter subunit IIA [Deltaproteobacteria bacterium]|nr:PTS sugar transporter subunit IIA [Deltaproteobacteria bacterium]
MNAILAVSILVAAGLAGGLLARRLRLPAVTGNILMGIVIGPHLTGILDYEIVYQTLRPISEIALGLIAVTIAAHLRLRRLAGQKFRLLFIAVLQSGGAFLAVFFACRLLLHDWVPAILLAVIAASTAPAATLAVIRETEARGPLVKTIVAVVALDNVFAILLFVVISSWLSVVLQAEGLGVSRLVAANVARILSLSLLLGVLVSLALLLGSRWLRQKYQYLTGITIAIFFTTGVALWWHVSPLLPNMVVGFLVSNLSPVRREILTALEDIEPLIFISFFTLAGTHLDIHLLAGLGGVGLVYILARYGGKLAGAWTAALLAGMPAPVRNCLGFCLLPQAGIAVGLVVAVQENPLFSPYESLITAVVLTAIVVSELAGPVISKYMLSRAGEVGREGYRLFGIVPRQGIVLPVEAEDKWEVIEELVGHAARVYQLDDGQRQALLASVVEREKSLSTGVGKGIAIPHGTINQGSVIRGILGVKPAGVDFQSMDGEPARVIILMLIPEKCFRDHLLVLAEISKVMSRSEVVSRVTAAKRADEVYHILFAEEVSPGDYLAGEGIS